MFKRVFLLLALAATVALPFLLRPRQPTATDADDTLVLITPHNEAIRHEFEVGFQHWYRARTGRSVFLDWRVVGGTSDIIRYLDGEYTAAFRNYWTGRLGHPWSTEVQSGFKNSKLPATAPEEIRAARTAFLHSKVSCGIDLFYGGGNYEFVNQANAGTLVDSGLLKLHPEWFTEAVMPRFHDGEEYWDSQGLWFGTVVSSYGILFNRDSLRRLGFHSEPNQWTDLADARFRGEIALCDPTKSGSIAAAFEEVIQQQMQRRLTELRRIDPAGEPKVLERQAVREGWITGIRLLQLIGANARYFTDTSQKPAIDVGAGDCAAGMCIDFYGREEADAVFRRTGTDRLGYVSPPGGSAYSVDPIGLLRGAPHAAVGAAFIEFALSLEGQKLWNFLPGTPDGPQAYALRRLPVRRDFYDHTEWRSFRSDPDVNPYAAGEGMVYHSEWTGALFGEIGFITRVMVQDTHPELVKAWAAIAAAPEPARTAALKILQDVSAVDYEAAFAMVKPALHSKNQADEVRLARDLGDHFRLQYLRAEAAARAGGLRDAR